MFIVNGREDDTLEDMSGKEIEAIEIALGEFGLEYGMHIESLYEHPFYVQNPTQEFIDEYVGENKGPFPLNYKDEYYGLTNRNALDDISVKFVFE